MLVQRHAADIDAFVAGLTPKVARQQRHVIGLYLGHLDNVGVTDLTAEERILTAWLKHPPWTTPTRKLYGGMVRRFVRTVTGGGVAPAAPDPGPTLLEPVDVPAPRVRARTPEEIAERRAQAEFLRQEDLAHRRARARPEAVAERTIAGFEPPAARDEVFIARLADMVVERAGITKLREKVDEIAVALDQRPIVSAKPDLLALDTPREVMRHQLMALVRVIGIDATADLLDVAPSGLARMEKGGGIPRVPDQVALDNAYVRLRWIQRELAEDDELDDVAKRVRAVARAELDERAQEVR